jgi:hypothetical protein
MYLHSDLSYWKAVSEEKAAEKLEQEVESHRAQYPELQDGVIKEDEQEQKLYLLLK